MNTTTQPGPLEVRLNDLSGLVERLRNAADVWGEDDGGLLYAEAADEIERAWAARDAAVSNLEARRRQTFKEKT